jgi:hypothetical protein
MDKYNASEQAYKNGYSAGYEAGRRSVSKQKWIPVTERLPESGVHVLVACEMYGHYLHGQYVCDGFYVDRYTQKVENIDYDIACEYCEEDDEYYLWQGWYEVIKNWDDYNSIVIGDTVTHWMPLPEPPNCGADMRGEEDAR